MDIECGKLFCWGCGDCICKECNWIRVKSSNSHHYCDFCQEMELEYPGYLDGTKNRWES